MHWDALHFRSFEPLWQIWSTPRKIQLMPCFIVHPIIHLSLTNYSLIKAAFIQNFRFELASGSLVLSPKANNKNTGVAGTA